MEWPGNPALGWLRQNDHKFKVSLRYINSARPAWITKIRMASKQGHGWEEPPCEAIFIGLSFHKEGHQSSLPYMHHNRKQKLKGYQDFH